MSIQTQTQSGSDSNQNDTETIPNPERGCGFLKDGKAYLRADTAPGGVLPAFVEFAEPIPFKEDRKRSYKAFPGIQFELSVTGEGGITQTIPESEVHEHLRRLDMDRPTGTHAGEMVSFESHDLLMSVGKTHYPDVQKFISEAKVHGVNKAISVTSGNEPPKINPGRTRLFLIHPNAVEVTYTDTEGQEVEKEQVVELENGDTKTVTYSAVEEVEIEKTRYTPGIFGYTYLTRVVYTEDADGEIPKYIQDYEATGGLDVVKPDDPTPYEEQVGFDEDGSLTADADEVLEAHYGDSELPAATDAESEPVAALEAPTIERMEKADLGALAEEPYMMGMAPPEGQDAVYGDEGGALAVISIEDRFFKLMPSNNVRQVHGDDDTVTGGVSTVGPYKVSVEVAEDSEKRRVEVINTR